MRDLREDLWPPSDSRGNPGTASSGLYSQPRVGIAEGHFENLVRLVGVRLTSPTPTALCTLFSFGGTQFDAMVMGGFESNGIVRDEVRSRTRAY